MEKLCKFCRFWTEYKADYYPYHPGIGGCNHGNFVYTGQGDETPVNGLGYWDQDSYRAGFETGSDFGCIHFEQRDTFLPDTTKIPVSINLDEGDLEIV
jgi:hypothetical protein